MKIRPLSFFFCLILFCCASCSSYRKVPYLQTREKAGEIELFSLMKESMFRFQPDDVLSITVNVAGESAVAYDYNLPMQPAATTHSSETYVDQGVGRQSYLVNKEGKIDFPVLGQIHVEGYTREELEAHLKSLLRKYLEVDPIVTVQLMNFRISILGEVNNPGQYTVVRDRINVLEALAIAGDMTIYGKRDEVKLIRETAEGSLKIITFDISKADVVSTPNFYLKQGDLLYVVPNFSKTSSASIGAQTSLLFSITGIVMTAVGVVIGVLNYQKK